MELKNNHLLHASTLSMGLVIGWVLQPWTETKNLDSTKANSSQRVTAANDIVSSRQVLTVKEEGFPLTKSIENEELSLSNADDELSDDQSIDRNNWSGQQLLDYISALEEKDFWGKINSGEIILALENSTLLLDEFMTSALDNEDKSLKRRLLYLFENVQTRYNEGQAATKNPIEEWIIGRVNSENRSSEWLAYLSQLGVSSKASYMSLTTRLRDFPTPDQTTSILSILARKPYLLGKSMSSDELALIEEVVEPYFSSQDSTQRMFAVASLSSLPFEKSEAKLKSAMTDESVRVRMSAMRIIRDNGFNSPHISASLMSSLSNKTLSAYERLGAYEVLSRTELSQEQYEAVYEFAINERVALEKEFHANRQAAQKENQ